jgi:DNA-binding MltR family transcriptional regulator
VSSDKKDSAVESVSKTKKHDSSRLQEDFEEFISEFGSESDRAAVILGASKIDQLLGSLLERYFLPSPTSEDALFSNNGPLGTFSAKVDLSYRLGLIDAQFSKSIHLVRRIRNSFAHEAYGAKLSSGTHKDRVKSLAAPFQGHEWFSSLKKLYFNDIDESRADFSTTLGLMIIMLEKCAHYVEPVSDSAAKSVVIDEPNKNKKENDL